MNLKRIIKAVDEVDGAGLVDAIQSLFRLPPALAASVRVHARITVGGCMRCSLEQVHPRPHSAPIRKYARIIFLASNRIEVYKNRKRLASLSFEVHARDVAHGPWARRPTYACACTAVACCVRTGH